jgi:hypothetical protein
MSVMTKQESESRPPIISLGVQRLCITQTYKS